MFICDLYIYPVKGCRGIRVSKAAVTARGLQHDRRWMVVDAHGTFISQRSTPKLALVQTALQENRLVLEAPDMPPITRPLELTDGETIKVEIWKEHCGALVDQEASRWFSKYVGKDCRAVFMPESSRRSVDAKFGKPQDIVSFADGYPLLVTTTASLEDLYERVGESLSMSRFRPNVVVDGARAYEEDDWTSLRVDDGLSFRAVKRCSRCSVTTVDQQTSRVGKEPLKTLATYRQTDNETYFGMNLIPDGPGGLSVGDNLVAQSD